MAGPFDDLIPTKTASNPFADLIPKADVTPDRVVRSLAQGASFGLADEFAAMMDAATHPLLGRGSTAETYGQRYEQNLSKERGHDKAFAEQHPYVDAAGQIVGGVGSAIATLPAGLTALGPSALGNVAKATGVGAGLGATAGFGEGEGLEDRLMKAGLGATVGGGLGLMARPLAAVGRSVAESRPGRAVGDPLSRMGSLLRGETAAVEPTAERGAAERIASTFQRDHLTPEIAQQRLTALGPEAIPSDISQSLLQQGVNMKTLGGETRQRAQDLFDPFMGQGRDARTGARMIAAAEGNAPPPSHFALTGEGQAFDQNARAVGSEVYGAMGGEKLRISSEMQQIMREAPAIGETLAGIEAQHAKLGERLTPIELVDKVKQQLNRDATAAFNAGTGVDKAAVGNLADRFEAAFWRANPKAQEAAAAYRQAKSLPEHYQAGSSIFTKGMGEKATAGSAPALEDLLQGVNAQQTAATRAGVVNAVRARAGTQGGALTMAQDIKTGVNSGGVQESLQAVMPNEAQNLINRASAERIYANTSRRYLGGPHTADDVVGAAGFGDNLSVRGTPGGGIIPRFQESLRAAANWVAAPNEAVRNQIGRMLLDADPATQRRTLELISQILQQRAAGTPAAAGVAGVAGAQAGRAF